MVKDHGITPIIITNATVIVKNSNPYLADAIREFTETTQMLNAKL